MSRMFYAANVANLHGGAGGGFLEPPASFLFGAHFSFSKEKCVKKIPRSQTGGNAGETAKKKPLPPKYL